MAKIICNCTKCGFRYTTHIDGEGWIYCPQCGNRFYRRYEVLLDTYCFLTEDDYFKLFDNEKKNDR